MVRRVKYIYDYQFRVVNDAYSPYVAKQKVPVACIVSDGENFGLSTCCKGSVNRGSDTFCKYRARKIAEDRMLMGIDVNVPNRKLTNPHGKKTTLADEVNFWVERMTTQTV